MSARRLAGAALLVLAGCGRAESAGAPPPDDRSQAQAAAAALHTFGGSPLSRPACATAPPAAAPGLLVLVNGRQCLSCRDMGYALRRLAARRQDPAVVVVPARDTAQVCAFLRNERVRLPVTAAADTRGTLGATVPVVAVRVGAGTRDSTYWAANGQEMLRQIESASSSSSSSIPQPSPPSTSTGTRP